MTATVLLLLGAVGATGWAMLEWRRRDGVAAVGLVVGALVLTVLASVALTVVVLACGGVVAWHRWGHAATVVTRWGAQARRRHGVASTLDILRVGSWVAMRRKATTLRPSLAELTRSQRVRVRTTQLAVPLCRTGALRVWASVEDVVCVFGRPRSGKSGWLAHHIIDAPGAVLVTSTRTDLHELTAGVRAKRGPVAVFNPTGLAGLPSTVAFNPVAGCADPVTAHERATDLIGAAATAGGGGDHQHWLDQARRVLTALLHAAALGGLGMPEVLRWVANPDTAARQVLSLLRRSPAAAAYVPDVEQFVGTNDRTRSSITSSIMPALGWLSSPAACAATTGTAPLEVAQWLQSGGSLYLLGAEETHIAPLVAALTGHIAREARRLAAAARAGRLDPPLTLVLDEAALICPVPLHEWTSDMGGRGVQIIAAFQSRAQLVARWGEAAARVILNNTGAAVLFSYGGDTADLAHWSALTGERHEPQLTRDATGRVTTRTTRAVPVISPAQLTTLPRGRVVVFRHGLPVVTGRVRMAWTRSDVRAAARVAARAARQVVTAAEHVTRSAPTTPATSPGAAPIPSPAWVAGTRGGTHSTNGTHPAGETPPA